MMKQEIIQFKEKILQLTFADLKDRQTLEALLELKLTIEDVFTLIKEPRKPFILK